jgi:hypothetical protein
MRSESLLLPLPLPLLLLPHGAESLGRFVAQILQRVLRLGPLQHLRAARRGGEQKPTQSIDQPTNQPINRSINQSVGQLSNQTNTADFPLSHFSSYTHICTFAAYATIQKCVA